jgi:hypothetical protein
MKNFSQRTVSILALGSMLMAFSSPAHAPELAFDKVNESIAEVTTALRPQIEDLSVLKIAFMPEFDPTLSKAAIKLVFGFKKSFFAPKLRLKLTST